MNSVGAEMFLDQEAHTTIWREPSKLRHYLGVHDGPGAEREEGPDASPFAPWPRERAHA